MDSIMKTVRLS